MDNRFKWAVSPVALPQNTVCGKNYRFTVVTDRLLRLEYSENGVFEDRASQTFFYRDLPAVDFSTNTDNGVLTINTGSLLLTYCENAEFSADTLSVKLLIEPASEWRFGDELDTLGGTSQTLDTINGAVPLGNGLVSIHGFSVVDDSKSLVLGDDGWVEVRNEGCLDFYFFGYGFDYNGCIKDFYRVTGMPTMLPAYALGNWWSRYHKYTDREYLNLMQKFQDKGIPFSVGIVDMDWHITDIPEEKRERLTENDLYVPEYGGWTGYTVNREYFPDYKEFLKSLHDEYHIRTAFNLHPAAGVLPHEEQYEEMCKRMGQDPNEMRRVPFDILSQKYMANYFDLLHHPYEENGVDFWWMDWQQGTRYEWIHKRNADGEYQDPRERLNPLWMINHLHNLDISRNGKRPMFFSRYSGLGSQRYAIGFSGDTSITWDSLAFQPEFTVTSANVGYCQWSHDIGGHMLGYSRDDLYLRWVQFGVFSPINRLHSSNQVFIKKEPWGFSAETEKIATSWLQLRHRLFPYIYTMNYHCATEGDQLIKPLYFNYPKNLDAYKYPNQYFFGTQLMVAPITEPNAQKTGLAGVDAWLPSGDWFDMFNGLHYHCEDNRKMRLCRDSSTIPVLAKAGAIVPLYDFVQNELKPQESVTFLVFPGDNGEFTLYEDACDGDEYKNGAFALTKATLEFGESAVFTIHPAVGDLSLIPESRNYTVALRGFNKNITATVGINGSSVPTQISYDANTNTTFVTVSAMVCDTVTLTVTGAQLLHDNSDVDERITQLFDKADMPYDLKEKLRFGRLNVTTAKPHARLYPLVEQSYEYRTLGEAVKELLTLTEVEFIYGTNYVEGFWW